MRHPILPLTITNKQKTKMKTLITLNIGLTTTKKTRVDIHHAISAIVACGVSVTSSAVVNGEWEGKPEQTLFIQGFVQDPHGIGFRAQLYLASRLLSQHCLALWFDGKGELIGDNPDKWEFDASLFHFHPEGKRPELPLSECQAIQAEHAAKIAAMDIHGEDRSLPLIVNDWTAEKFCSYLEETLIPDLKESGLDATAQDFETAVEFIRG